MIVTAMIVTTMVVTALILHTEAAPKLVKDCVNFCRARSFANTH
jgi:hypothetical protein